MTRILTGVVAAVLGLLAVFLLPPDGFFLVALSITLASAWEFARIVRKASRRFPTWWLLLLTVILTILMSRPGWVEPWLDGRLGRLLVAPGGAILLACSLLGLSAAAALFSREGVERSLAVAGALTFGGVYFSLAGASVVRIRDFDPMVLLWLLLVVWVGDTAAYYGGKTFGRHKLARIVSPNKTWEGSAFSLLGALAATGVWFYLVSERVEFGVGAALVLAALASLSAQTGDLIESMVKRGAAVKDSGTILPGHGGVWDRMDALLYSAPLFYLGLFLLDSRLFDG